MIIYPAIIGAALIGSHFTSKFLPKFYDSALDSYTKKRNDVVMMSFSLGFMLGYILNIVFDRKFINKLEYDWSDYVLPCALALVTAVRANTYADKIIVKEFHSYRTGRKMVDPVIAQTGQSIDRSEIQIDDIDYAGQPLNFFPNYALKDCIENSQVALNCPITMEEFTNPVTANCGHSFDYSSIKENVERGQSVICPIGREELKTMYYNKHLKNFLDRRNGKAVEDKNPTNHLIVGSR